LAPISSLTNRNSSGNTSAAINIVMTQGSTPASQSAAMRCARKGQSNSIPAD
jgi:alkyl hydroperoxide reductase subunit AhpF